MGKPGMAGSVIVAAAIAAQVQFAYLTKALALTNQTGYRDVPTEWLTNWPESSVFSDPALSVHDKYLLGLDPTTSSTYTLSVGAFIREGSNAVTVIKRTCTGGASPDGMHGCLQLQTTPDLGVAFSNVTGTTISGTGVFDGNGRRCYTNTFSGSSPFIRAVIQ